MSSKPSPELEPLTGFQQSLDSANSILDTLEHLGLIIGNLASAIHGAKTQAHKVRKHLSEHVGTRADVSTTNGRDLLHGQDSANSDGAADEKPVNTPTKPPE